ncbi:DUF2946 domain-containing protein [Massilia sp. TSP1-1-2]|uniref:DUF2946 domain-containing protein n=1 Tax=unclassified Massilia TaxID=2609279 RepID=UPI003CEB5A62
MNTITRRFAAWIACFAMLFAALAPSAAQAMAASRGDTWTEICSAAGVKMVKADGADAQQVSVHLEHCPFCATHAPAIALLPGTASSMPLLKGRDTHPSLFFQSPSPLAIWTLAQSRAPPVHA